ncbi:MAG: hypothetical protein ACYC5R_06270 [Melioribacteraceae bacterium]
MLNYKKGLVNEVVVISSKGKRTIVKNSDVLNAILYTHETIDKFKEFEVDVFKILGMRNLSAFIGEIVAASLKRATKDLFMPNPHQDGYPDLLLMDELGKKDWDKLKNKVREKQPFSPFPNGGIELKATVGSVPTPAVFQKKGLNKPDIGEQRINSLMGYDWKAHHRETNNLMGVVWDFIGGVPRIVGIFFSNELTVNDWGKIIKPKDNGGRTTSVSIMTREGVQKMYKGCVYVLDDKKYIDFFNRYNKLKLL